VIVGTGPSTRTSPALRWARSPAVLDLCLGVLVHLIAIAVGAARARCVVAAGLVDVVGELPAAGRGHGEMGRLVAHDGARGRRVAGLGVGEVFVGAALGRTDGEALGVMLVVVEAVVGGGRGRYAHLGRLG
jgi:hypothetical protein